MDAKSAVAARISELCEHNKLTVNALAYTAGMSSSTIYRMLNTKSKNPGVISLQKICDALEISMREFFDSPLFENLEPIVK